MQLAESFMVYALLVLARMALPTILCCGAFIFVMSLILLGIWEGHYPVLSGLMPSFLVVRRQGFVSNILVTQYPLCDLSLIRLEVMATVAGLLQALLLVMAFRY
jgi:hypothetical protein